MPRRAVDANRLRYTIADETPVAESARFWALVQGRAVDELTGEAPLVLPRVSTRVRGIQTRVGDGGLFGLLGYPTEVFPSLDAQGYAVPFRVQADGYVARAETAQVPADAQFPARYIPTLLPDLALHREPVTLFGRLVDRPAPPAVNVAGSTVRVTEVWRQLQPPGSPVPPLIDTLVSLHPPLYSARTAATGRIRRRVLNAVLGLDKTLLEPAGAGANEIRLSDWQGLILGDVLEIDADAAVQEHVTIVSIDPIDTPAFPARIGLAHPLAFAHRLRARVREATPQPPGVTRAFVRDAIVGDTCAFVSTLAGLPNNGVVEVFGGGAPEFHRLRQFTVQANAAGEWRMPPLSRVAQLTIEAIQGPDTAGPATVIPDYTRRENLVELRF